MKAQEVAKTLGALGRFSSEAKPRGFLPASILRGLFGFARPAEICLKTSCESTCWRVLVCFALRCLLLFFCIPVKTTTPTPLENPKSTQNTIKQRDQISTKHQGKEVPFKGNHSTVTRKARGSCFSSCCFLIFRLLELASRTSMGCSR